MVLKKTRKRLTALYDDLASEDRAKISAGHVEEILDKIDRKHRKILRALDDATNDEIREKLARKLAVIEEQKARGNELLRIVQDR